MAKTVLTITDAIVQMAVGATEPVSWPAVTDSFECQVVEARIRAEQSRQTAPATFCTGETDRIGLSKYTVELTGLQDWTLSTGLSVFLMDNDAADGWIRISMPTNASGDDVAVAVVPVQFAAGDFGGPAGSPLQFSVSMPCQAAPTITQSTLA